MAETERLGWLETYSLVLTPDAIRSMRRDPDFEAMTGSKWAAFPWLALIAVPAGALGGLSVSGALWSRWWQVPLLLLVLVLFAVAVHKATSKRFEGPIRFLAGWSLFFGVLLGLFTMWAAQLSSTAWCYGIAGGAVFFLLGITGGNLEPPNSKPMEDWFLTSAVFAPAGSCFAAWLYRNQIPEPGTLFWAAAIGAIAAFPFLAVTMGLHLKAWRPERGLDRLARLLLHSDAAAAEAAGLLNRLIAAEPANAELHSRRGLAHRLAGEPAAAEADWAQARTLGGAVAVDLMRGWAALRRDDAAGAAAAFRDALAPEKRNAAALLGLGVALLRAGEAQEALATLKRIPAKRHDALSLTHLAEAHLATGDAPSALSIATDAIEEADSIHGRSWLVRAEAQVALGRIDAAAEDYNRALWAADEVGIEQRALAGLEAIDRPVTEDEPD